MIAVPKNSKEQDQKSQGVISHDNSCIERAERSGQGLGRVRGGTGRLTRG